MSYIIWFLFILSGVIRSNSKLVNALQKTWIVVMWGMANEIADIGEYKKHFLYSIFDLTPKHLFLEEGIYRNFCYIFRVAGFSFDVYLIILAIFCVLVIDKILDYFAIEQKGFVWSALMLFPMHEFNVVLQGRLAFCVVLLGLPFLKEKKIKNMIYLGLSIVVAGCIHTGAYEFVLLYVIYFFKDRKRAIAIVSVGIVAELIFANAMKEIIYTFNVEGFRAIDGYFEDAGNYGKAVGHIVLYAVVILGATYGYKSIDKTEKMEILHRVMWAMMLGYPLVVLSTQFRRNLEMMFYIPYMCVAYNVSQMYKLGNKVLLKLITVIVAIVLFFGLHVRNFSQFQINYIQYVINGNYISQGIEQGSRLLVMIFIFMLFFIGGYLKTKFIICNPTTQISKVRFTIRGR